MQFRIADTFTDSLAELTGDEQKAVKTAAFDLQMNPAHPGLKLHQIDRAKDKDFSATSTITMPHISGPTTAAGTASDDRSGAARRDPGDGP